MKHYQNGMHGVYLAAAELTRRGLIVSPTLRNAPVADLLVTDPQGKRAWSVQVKTNRGRMPYWLLSEKSKTIASPSHVYIFVTLEGKAGPEYLPVGSEYVASHIDEEHRQKSSFYSFDRRNLQPGCWGWEIFGIEGALADGSAAGSGS